MRGIPSKFKTKKKNLYLMLAIAEELNIPINIWFDYDSIEKKEKYMHSFLEIPGIFFLDSYGLFKKIEERFYDQEFDFVNVEKLSSQEARERIKKTGFNSTDISLKKECRMWFRKNWLVYDVFREGNIESWSYFGFGYSNKFLFVSLYETGVLSRYIHQINQKIFQNKLKIKEIYFEPRKQFIDATMNTVFSIF